MIQQLSAFSWWGAVLVLVLSGMATAAFVFVDRRFVLRVLQVAGYFTGQLLAAGACVWLLWRLDCWWADLLWGLLMIAAVAAVAVDKARLPWQRMLPVVAFSLLAGMLLPVAALLLSFHPSGIGVWRLFVPIVFVLLGQLYGSVTHALQTYTRQLRHTRDHYRYLLANGGTHLEALMPSIRRGMRAAVLPLLTTMVKPLLIVQPLLFCGLLLTGTPPVVAVAATLLMAAASLAAQVASSALLFWLADRLFFNRQGTFTFS
jgi:putative ABC transport system permease protein